MRSALHEQRGVRVPLMVPRPIGIDNNASPAAAEAGLGVLPVVPVTRA